MLSVVTMDDYHVLLCRIGESGDCTKRLVNDKWSWSLVKKDWIINEKFRPCGPNLLIIEIHQFNNTQEVILRSGLSEQVTISIIPHLASLFHVNGHLDTGQLLFTIIPLKVSDYGHLDTGWLLFTVFPLKVSDYAVNPIKKISKCKIFQYWHWHKELLGE